MHVKGRGFTLIELMIVIAVLAILVAIALPQYSSLVNKAGEASTKGNLGTLRSALAIYFGDNDSQNYPSDDLTSLSNNMKYLPRIPAAKLPPFHVVAAQVVVETDAT